VKGFFFSLIPYVGFMSSTIDISSLIAGTRNWGASGARFNTYQYISMIEKCLACNINTFEHADIYGHYTTEEEFGNALRENSSLRHQIRLISKCGINIVSPARPVNKIRFYDTSAEHIIRSVDQSLINLNTDYLDVLLLHQPDPLMNPDEIAAAFTALQAQGKVRSFGVANFTPSQVNLLYPKFPIHYHQLGISLLELQPFTDGRLDNCLQHCITPMAVSPLGGGNIFLEQITEREKRIVAVATFLAKKYNVLPDQVMLAWLLVHPSGIIPVLGTSKFERIELAAKATTITIERQDWFLLWRASTGTEVA
jgi:predicted oxidoreductase